jgi:hypothetical protein
MALARIEPWRTIYGPAWQQANEAVAQAPDDDVKGILRELLTELEAGWARVRPLLEIKSRACAGTVEDRSPVAEFALEVVENFRELAESSAEWVCAYLRHGDSPSPRLDPESMATELSRFSMHAAVLALAAHSAGTDPQLDALASNLAREAPRWTDTLEAIIRRLPE